MPGIVVGSEDTAENKLVKTLLSWNLHAGAYGHNE